MSGDYSRFNFDPTHDYDGVLLQQGRPLTDWDWNEEVILRSRRRQASVADMFADWRGKAVYPATTAHGFEIKVAAGQMTIGPGRLYVDGIMIENHGLPPLAWDPLLAEQVGTLPTPFQPAVPRGQPCQPYYPNPPPLPTSGGPYIVYVDVWQREVTRLQQADLVDPALGVDTTTRVQTVWQVKLTAQAPTGTLCSSDIEKMDAWQKAIRAPSGGRLTTGTGGSAAQTDSCQIPPAAGYKGLENQLYRVEIHDGGPDVTTPTFKWSRDNASIETRVLQVMGGQQLIVESTHKDDYFRFNSGDWIEITDDWREFSGKPGQILRIADGNGVDDDTGTITLTAPVDGTLFPVDGTNTPLQPNLRIRRWDQRTSVLHQDGSLYWDPKTSATGLIPVPPPGVPVILEAGVMVTFSVAVGGIFNEQDYWTFTARASTGKVEALTEAPPRGIHHHYAKLAVVTFPDGSAADCRVRWPPLTAADLCGCKVCVTPELHNGGTLTIEEAVNKAAATGGMVCLMPGDYRVAAPVKIANVRSVRVVGQGSLTRVVSPAGPAFDLSGGRDIVLSDFAIVTGGGGAGGTATTASYAAVRATDVDILQLERLFVNAAGAAVTAVAVGGSVDAKITDCRVQAAIGIGWLPAAAGSPAASAPVELLLESSVMACTDYGVQLAPTTDQRLRVRIASNQFGDSARAAINVTGGSTNGYRVDIVGNRIGGNGSGIVARVPGARVVQNDLAHTGQQGVFAGLDLHGGDPNDVPRDWFIAGNRIINFPGAGIVFGGVAGGMVIAQNIIEQVGHGIVLASDTLVQSVSIEGNEVSNATGVGLAVQNAQSASVGANLLRRIGTAAATVAMHVSSCVRVDVSRNEVTGIGPSGSFNGKTYGIAISQPIGLVHVRGNVVRRDLGANTTADAADFRALVVGAVASASGVSSPVENLISAIDQLSAGGPQSSAASQAGQLAGPGAAAVSPATPVPAAGTQASPSAAPSPASTGAAILQPAAQLQVSQTTGSMFAGLIFQAPPATFLTNMPTPERVVVEGNELEARGSGPVVHIDTAGDCTFTGNHCLHRGSSVELSQPGQNVFIRAVVVVFCNNRTKGGAGAGLHGPKDSSGKETDVVYNAIGNVVRGDILVNGKSLANSAIFKLLPDGVLSEAVVKALNTELNAQLNAKLNTLT